MIEKFTIPFKAEVCYLTKEKEIIKREDFENSENKNRFLFVYEVETNEKIRKLIILLNETTVSNKKSIILIKENKEIKIFNNVSYDFEIPL